MGKLLGIVVIYISSISLAGILSIGLFFIFLYFKKRIHHMTEEKWDLYFKRMNHKAFLMKSFFIYIFALCLITILAYHIFELLSYTYSSILSIILIMVGLSWVCYDYMKDKDKLLKKLDRLHQ